MDAAIRRAALRSAAKLALGASFLGGQLACGGAVSDDGGGLGSSAGAPGATGGSAGRTGTTSSGGSVAVTGGTTGGGGDGGQAGSPSSDPVETDGAAGAQAPSSWTDAGSEGVLACIEPVGAFDAAIQGSVEDLTCCMEYAAAAAPDPNEPVNDADTVVDPSLVNCCRYISRVYDSTFATEVGWPADAYGACCHRGLLTPEETMTAFCSPWGPPVPPALDPLLELAA